MDHTHDERKRLPPTPELAGHGIMHIDVIAHPRADSSIVKPYSQTLADGLRAALLRTPRGSGLRAGAGVFVAFVATYLFASLLVDGLDTPSPWRFDSGGVLVVLGDALLTLIAGWLLARLAQRDEFTLGVASTLLAATALVAVLVHWPLRLFADLLHAHGQTALGLLVALIGQSWWFFVLLVVAHGLIPRSFARAVVAAVLGYAISAASWWYLPSVSMLDTAVYAPVAASDEAARPVDGAADTQAATAGTDGEVGSAGTEALAAPAFDPEQVMYDQPALLDAALAQLTPRTPGKINLYAVIFAGDGSQDVFRNEAEYAQRLFEQRFDAKGHVVVLENNPSTVGTRPLASWTNLQRTLQAIAQKMDPAQDIVLLYLTTHGSSDHVLLVDLDPLPLNQIAPEDVVDAFKTTPAMRWKVVVVNACYSGGFIDALRDDSTLVMTSARSDRTSFGCGTDSDITWFGKALLVDALNQTTSLPAAFAIAREEVARREAEDAKTDPELLHSEPQISTSASIDAKLARWSAGLSAGPAVEFKPAVAHAQASDQGEPRKENTVTASSR